MEVQIPFRINVFVFFGYILRKGIVGPFVNSIFIFSRKLHIVFHTDCTSLHLHQQCTRVPCYPHLVNICFLCVCFYLFIYLFFSFLNVEFFFFSFIFISWRLITLQLCIEQTFGLCVCSFRCLSFR